MSEKLKKTIPSCPDSPTFEQLKQEAWGRESRTFEIQLITPMFGGGVEAGVNDASYPIRGTAIRGHLRYWWRMTIGKKLASQAMWQREEEIFGSTNFPSPLAVKVSNQPQLKMVNPEQYGGKSGPHAYALFPAMTADIKRDVAKENIGFDLKLSWDNEAALMAHRQTQNAIRQKNKQNLLPDKINPIDKDILTALEAWCLLGGLGARTRRGCGAIYCSSIESDLPTIPCRYFLGTSKRNAIEAWKDAVEKYQNFRQKPRGASHDKTITTRNGQRILRDIPGRSHWPEADSIRKITGCSLKPNPNVDFPSVSDDENTHDHSTPVVPVGLLPAFPKAVMGLPINFHFSDSPHEKRPAMLNKDPKDVQLVPLLPNTGTGKMEKFERMASPVITRPIWKNGHWCPAIIILKSHLPQGFQVRLEGKQAMRRGTDLSCDIDVSHVIDTTLGDLEPMRKQASSLDALALYLKDNDFKETPL